MNPSSSYEEINQDVTQRGIPKDDSGYYSMQGEWIKPNELSKLTQGTFKKDIRLFKEFIDELERLEFSESDTSSTDNDKTTFDPAFVQFFSFGEFTHSKEHQKAVNNYITHFAIALEEIEQQIERQLSRLDIAIKDKFTNSALPSNEGAAFLAIVRSCSNKQVIEGFLKLYSVEKNKTCEELVEQYIDKNGANILHLLAQRTFEPAQDNQVNEKIQETFKYFSEQFPKLKELKDSVGRTPEEIIAQRKMLSLFKTFIGKLCDLAFLEGTLSSFDDKSNNQYQKAVNDFLSQLGMISEIGQQQANYGLEKLDMAIKDEFINSKLTWNEGAAFLAIVRSCSNEEVIERFLQQYCIEKGKTNLELLTKYIDNDNANILHLLAENIVQQKEQLSPLSVIQKTWRLMKSFAKLVPTLEEAKDSAQRTPEEIIMETDLSLDDLQNKEEDHAISHTIPQEVLDELLGTEKNINPSFFKS